MNEKQKAEVTNGMFAGATFVDSVVVGVAEAGSEVFYNKGEGAEDYPYQGDALSDCSKDTTIF